MDILNILRDFLQVELSELVPRVEIEPNVTETSSPKLIIKPTAGWIVQGTDPEKTDYVMEYDSELTTPQVPTNGHTQYSYDVALPIQITYKGMGSGEIFTNDVLSKQLHMACYFDQAKQVSIVGHRYAWKTLDAIKDVFPNFPNDPEIGLGFTLDVDRAEGEDVMLTMQDEDTKQTGWLFEIIWKGHIIFSTASKY